MTLEVLLSCMHQKDDGIITRSNLGKVKTLVVDQCDIAEDEMVEINHLHRLYHTNTRGLSVSRNLAIQNAQADICLLSDDDEIFVDALEERISRAYERFPEADLIIFQLSNRYKKLGDRPRQLRKYDLLRVASWQISFRLSSVKDQILFDPLLGAGTGNGGGEENKFLLDCWRAGKKIFFVPEIIAEGINDSGSTWFSGWNKSFFYNRGKTTRYILGLPVSLAYAVYFLLGKRRLYRDEISVWDAAKSLLSGILNNDLARKEQQMREKRG